MWKTPMKECFLRFLNCTNGTKSRKESRMVQILLISAKKLKALQPFEMSCEKCDYHIIISVYSVIYQFLLRHVNWIDFEIV